MRLIVIVGLAGVLAACASVKIVQRDGCWIRRTERKLGGVTEEIGPCMRAEPKWVDDRLTRVVQECVAQSDYRWMTQALAAWSRGEPLPVQPEHDALVRECMRQGAAGVVAENENLKRRVQEIASDRERLRTGAERDRQQLRTSADRLADYLGEAAKKPPGNAFATATSTSDGTASTDNASRLQAEGGSGRPPPAASLAPPGGGTEASQVAPPGPAAPKAGAKQPRRKPPAPLAGGTGCDRGRALPADQARSPGAARGEACPPGPPAPPSTGAR